jgi:transcriptional regulator with XRE-family HTH domain
MEFEFMGLQKRLKSAIQNSGLSIPEFAKRIGVAGSTLISYRNGHTSPTYDLLMKICREFAINPRWLFLGEGPMRQGEADESGQVVYIDQAVQLVEEAIRETGVEISEMQKRAIVQLVREELKGRAIDLIKVLKGGGTKNDGGS